MTNQREFSLGALPRPAELATGQEKYRLAALPRVDPTQPYSLMEYVRKALSAYNRGGAPKMTDQDGEGRCVGNTVVECAMIAAAVGGFDPTAGGLSPQWVYTKARQSMGTFPQDSGAYIATGYDVSLDGIPSEDVTGESFDPAWQPTAAMDADAAGHDFILRHEPIDPASFGGSALMGVISALAERKPLAAGMSWLSGMDYPVKGVIPLTGQKRGDHAITLVKNAPALSGIWALNHWWLSKTQPWSPDAPQSDPEVLPGMFLIPYAAFDKGIVWEERATVAVVKVEPEPEPQPTPGVRRVAQVWSAEGGWHAVGDVTVPADATVAVALKDFNADGSETMESAWAYLSPERGTAKAARPSKRVKVARR